MRAFRACDSRVMTRAKQDEVEAIERRLLKFANQLRRIRWTESARALNGRSESHVKMLHEAEQQLESAASALRRALADVQPEPEWSV